MRRQPHLDTDPFSGSRPTAGSEHPDGAPYEPGAGFNPGSRLDPPRLLASDSLSPAARQLLAAPPPLVPLDARVATRVRTAVLQTPSAAAPWVKHQGSAPTLSTAWNYAKLGLVAGSAALFGAGAVLVSTGHLHFSTQRLAELNAQNDVTRSGAPLNAIDQRATQSRGLSPSNVPPNAAAGLAANAPEFGRGAHRDPASPALFSRLPEGAHRAEGEPATRGSAELTRGWPADEALRSPSSSLRANSELDDASRGAGLGRGTADYGGGASRSGNGGSADLAHPSDAHSETPIVLSVKDLASVPDGFENTKSKRTHAHVLVRPEFRQIASSKRASHKSTQREALNSLEEETLLLEEARSKLGRDPEAALKLALEHQSRFRRGQLLEQRRMIHLEALLRLGRDDEASALAKTIGTSLYRARAQALLDKYGI